MKDCQEHMLLLDLRQLSKIRLTGQLQKLWLWGLWYKKDSMWGFQEKMLKEELFHRDMQSWLTRRMRRRMSLYSKRWSPELEGSVWITRILRRMDRWDLRLGIRWSHQRIWFFGKLSLEIFTILRRLSLIRWSWVVSLNGFDKWALCFYCLMGSMELGLTILHVI